MSHVKRLLRFYSTVPQKQQHVAKGRFQTKPCILHKLKNGPESLVICNRDEALTLYKKMQSIRIMENAALKMYEERVCRGFLHLYNGEEAVAVGFASNLRPCDIVSGGYRIHAWAYLLGVPIPDILCELAGKQSGNVKGRGGSMHLYSKQLLGGNGIVGASVPIGVGAAFACKYKQSSGVCIALYGDGGANQGQIYEAYNLAKIWNLPVIFLCENNGFGMGTSVERASMTSTFHDRVNVIPGILVDGMDVLAVRECARFATEYCLKNGPLIVEAKTYRFKGHSASDPGSTYRTREEVQQFRENYDPVEMFKYKIMKAGLTVESELKNINRTIKEKIDKEIKSAMTDPYPATKDVATHVYRENIDKKIRSPDPLYTFNSCL